MTRVFGIDVRTDERVPPGIIGFNTGVHNGQHLGYCPLCVDNLTRITTPRTWARMHPVQHEHARLLAERRA